MYGNRPNVDLETMMDKVSTPNRLRAPSTHIFYNLSTHSQSTRTHDAHFHPQ